MIQVLLFFAIIMAVLFWFDAMKTKEHALSAARDYCEEQHLQLLDDTVSCVRLRLNYINKHFMLCRTYEAMCYDSVADMRRSVPIDLQNRCVIQVDYKAPVSSVVDIRDYFNKDNS
jgi:hypothetical protein